MIKLKNVSKYYYSKGVIASGFNKINLELKVGEFVVITGESGSGKSTLLNVISGLDTYEDGEMYVDGSETSHYTEKEFEIYRREYIGNIFQHFNLVNSYTVYQNIELVLLLNGHKKKEIKRKILEIIKQVNLTRYRNTKVSKLSGGQKQRVAIARALAKDTPIIVADEPTGNLDSAASASVLELLHEIAKEKLVVLVTHNYEQVEKYATRVIKMHDGKILEDKKLQNIQLIEKADPIEFKDITFMNRLRLGIRNTFNIIPKFLLLLLVYLFVTLAISGEYSSLQKDQNTGNGVNYNQFFSDTSAERIILQKNNKEIFTDNDYNTINNMDNINSIVKTDFLIDMKISIDDQDSFYFYGNVININDFKGPLDLGNMPQNDNEIIALGSEFDFYDSKILGKEYNLNNDYGSSNVKVKIVGIKYEDSNENKSIFSLGEMKFYVSEQVLETLRKDAQRNYSEVRTIINKNEQYRTIVGNDNVPEGKMFILEAYNYLCTNFNCINKNATINVKNSYYEDSLDLKISKTYNKKNFKQLTGLSDYDMNYGNLYISQTDYDKLFNKGDYQISVYVKNDKKIYNTIDKLNNLGYKTLRVKDALVDPLDGYGSVLDIIKVVFMVILAIALFFIAYFVIKLIMKSRNIYFSTIRILGASKVVAKKLLKIELLNIVNITYIIFIVLVGLVQKNVIKFNYVKDLSEYLKITDYILIYVILVIMSLLIANKYAKALFKKSALGTYREEV